MLGQEQSTEDIWASICECTKEALKDLKDLGHGPEDVKGIGFDATCSLAVFEEGSDRPISVSGPDFKDTQKNVICEFQFCGVVSAMLTSI